MNSYDLYIYSVFMCKLVMIITACLHFVLKYSSIHPDILSNLENTKNIFEFLFVFMMALLLLYIFNPFNPKQINYETRLLFFLLGVILLITAKYGIFLQETSTKHMLLNIQKLIGN